eukprot:CAMPEP_0205824776 /NCGR_PEP_ID=MMETSP0206-20130828/22582_1 /ASSEMBLY_ACC=CAM_ASM_000279 /TAXON_ID=36767 /ORGANISM="Euplotes focardii, Strain TN1" /LENGTH=269 /DNA_ID=CAMNT_0053123199 /DNA_START=81 /DNA_END=890 /DNA_ORIENTATION=+
MGNPMDLQTISNGSPSFSLVHTDSEGRDITVSGVLIADGSSSATPSGGSDGTFILGVASESDGESYRFSFDRPVVLTMSAFTLSSPWLDDGDAWSVQADSGAVFVVDDVNGDLKSVVSTAGLITFEGTNPRTNTWSIVSTPLQTVELNFSRADGIVNNSPMRLGIEGLPSTPTPQPTPAPIVDITNTTAKKKTSKKKSTKKGKGNHTQSSKNGTKTTSGAEVAPVAAAWVGALVAATAVIALQRKRAQDKTQEEPEAAASSVQVVQLQI